MLAQHCLDLTCVWWAKQIQFSFAQSPLEMVLTHGSSMILGNRQPTRSLHRHRAHPLLVPCRSLNSGLNPRCWPRCQSPMERMEVDDQEHRLHLLEQQMHQLSNRQTTLETTVTDHHAQSTAQVQGLQQQMMMQLDMQSKQMQGMLTDQMSRIEQILAKKPRTE